MDQETKKSDGGEPQADLTRKGFLRRQYGIKGILKMVILGLVTVAVLVSLFLRLDASRVMDTLGRADPALLVAAVLLGCLSPVAGSLRWFLLLKASDERIGYGTCLKVFYAALPANVLTPSKAGDLLRGVFLRDRVPVWKGMGIILTERVVDVSVLSILALAGSLVTGQKMVALAAAGVLALAASVFAASLLRIRLPLPRKVGSKVGQLFSGLRSLATRPLWLLAVAGGSCLTWCTNLMVTTLCFRALGADVSFVRVAGTMPIAIFVGLVPVTLSGMGTRDSAVVYLFSGAASQAVSLSVGLLYSLILYWTLALVGLPFLRSVLRSPRS